MFLAACFIPTDKFLNFTIDKVEIKFKFDWSTIFVVDVVNWILDKLNLSVNLNIKQVKQNYFSKKNKKKSFLREKQVLHGMFIPLSPQTHLNLCYQ